MLYGGADSQIATNRSFTGNEDIQKVFGILVSSGTIKETQNQLAQVYGFKTYGDYIYWIGKTDSNADENNDSSADDGGGNQKKNKQVKELLAHYKQQQTIQEWREFGIWDDSVSYNSWFHALGSYFTLSMPTARFNRLFSIFSKSKAAVKTSTNVLSKGDLLRIENAATRINKPITVVGSRASGTAKAYSDWDYIIEGGVKNSRE